MLIKVLIYANIQNFLDISFFRIFFRFVVAAERRRPACRPGGPPAWSPCGGYVRRTGGRPADRPKK